MKLEKCQKAIDMRRRGLPITDICTKLDVAKSTVFRWVKGVKLTAGQKEKLKSRKGKDMSAFIEHFKNKRELYQAGGKRRAKDGDLTHAMACMLYWAEGNKERNCCKMANCDPNLLRLFLNFLRKEFGVCGEEVCLRINCYKDGPYGIDIVEQYWLQQLGLPKCVLRKHTLKRSKTQQKVKYPYGICTISVNKTSIVQHIYGAIQEYGSFKNDKFLW